ncbi:Hypothetical predicted protein [Cloeon dipterum]|uniref:BRCT domain-containing protein n=1 Tax=Cloeon dipterum TaxID=197152 RepID=A0A8S1C003_9INSE|nr:Hypothetical predicted protein [Cloeon dipterum]
MPLLNDAKLKSSVESALQCLKCEKCDTVVEELCIGICVSHVFCKACKDNLKSCPSCECPVNNKNKDIVYVVDEEVSKQLKVLERLFQSSGTLIEKTPLKSAPPSNKGKKIPLTPAASPAKSECTVASTPASSLRGRRSSLGSPFPDINKRNSKGETLLQVACVKKNVDEVKRLLDAGANSCVRDYNGWTPLHEAAQSNRVDIAQLLLERGAKVNAAGGEEYLSPLHDAVSAGYKEMVELLLLFGADPDQLSIKGESARDMTKNMEILDLLGSSARHVHLSSSLDGCTQSNFFADGRPLQIMSAGLDKVQKSMLTDFVKTFSGKLSSKPNGDVKVVVAKDEKNKCHTSTAILAGIAAGAWIVRAEWLRVSLKNGELGDPKIYELHGTENSSMGNVFLRARTNSMEMLPGLFAGCHFFFSNVENFGADLNRESVIQIVKVMGGRVLSRSPDPEDIAGMNDIPLHANQSGPLAKCSHFIIYEKGKTKKNFIEFNMKHIKALEYSWLIKCIENFTLFDP